MANRAKLEKEIKEYCELNNINDVAGFITQCMLKGFNIFKFGMSPGDNINRQNGIVVDNGSNRGGSRKKETLQTKVEDGSHIAEKKQVKTEEKEPIVIKKRKIIVSNV